MIDSYKQYFKEASDNCWKCYINREEYEKKEREKYYGVANDPLTKIIRACEEIISNNNLSSKIIEEAIQAKRIAEEAQKECTLCGYRDTRIKNHLENYGIKII